MAKSELLKIQALCEAFIDFPEDMDEEYETSDIIPQMQTRIEEPLKELIVNYECGHVMREGIKIVIIGKPNVGKSSLMNRLLDKERVLVEVAHRVFNHYTKDPRTTEQALFDTLYEERIRLETEKDRSKAKKQAPSSRNIRREALQAPPTRQ